MLSTRYQFELPQLPAIWSLTALASEEVIDTLISLYFEHLYVLTPILHQPTFLAAYHGKLHTRDISFFSMLCALLSVTLSQVPATFLKFHPVGDGGHARMAVRADSMSRDAALKDSIQRPNLYWVAAKYLNALYHLHAGTKAVLNCSLGEAYALVSELALDKPETYSTLESVHLRNGSGYWLIRCFASVAWWTPN